MLKRGDLSLLRNAPAVQNLLSSLGEGAVTICQGYGVGTTVPLRTLAYAVPVLRLAYLVPAAHVEFYWATRGTIRANRKICPTQTHETSFAARRLLRAYVDRFHPSLASRVRILDDRDPCEQGERWISFIVEKYRCALLTVPGVEPFLRKRGDDAMRYMVEHALYMRDPILFENNRLPMLVNEVEYPTGQLLMVGGRFEEIFWKARQMLLQNIHVHDGWRSHQLFTGIGAEVPPYYPANGEPFADVKVGDNYSVDTLFEWVRRASPGLRRDWIALLQDAAGIKPCGSCLAEQEADRRKGYEALVALQDSTRQGFA